MEKFRIWIGAGLFIAGISTGWVANGWRLSSTLENWKKEQVEKLARAEQKARETETEWNRKIQEANNHAIEREKTIRTDADRARNAVDRLRRQLAALGNSLPRDTGTACLQRTDTLTELFADCAGKYRSMAETADRLDSDRRKLKEVWPPV